jgi:fucose 4-O-acetylase-like acetyltransferase
LVHVILGIRLAGVEAEFPEFELWVEKLFGSFHVPLFMFVSGYVYQLTGKWNPKGTRRAFLAHKFLNLGVPYVVFSAVYIVINSLTPGTNHANSITDILTIWKTPVAQYWFLYALLLLFVFWILLTNFMDDWKILIVLVVVNIAVQIAGIPMYSLRYMSSYVLVFGLGVCLPKLYVDKFSVPVKLGIVALQIAVVTVFFKLGMESYPVDECKRVIGVAGAIAFISLLYKSKPVYKFLVFINKYSLPIYLLHTIFTSAMRMVLKKVGVTNFALHTVAGLFVGVAVPLLIGWIAGKSPYLEFFFYPSKNIKRIKKSK